MGKILSFAVVLAAALTLGSVPGVAGVADVNLDDATDAGVMFDWNGDMARVAIVGADAGQTYAAYDSSGTALAGGVIDSDNVRFVIGDTGVGPDGSMVFVVVDDSIVAATDPNWEWN